MRIRTLIYAILLIALDAVPAAQATNCTTTCQNRNGQQECFTNCNSWNHA